MLSTYSYKAYDKENKAKEGQVEAPSIQEAFSLVKAMGLMPQKIIPISKKEIFDFKSAINKLKTQKSVIENDKQKVMYAWVNISLIILFFVFHFVDLLPMTKLVFMYVCFISVIITIFGFFQKTV